MSLESDVNKYLSAMHSKRGVDKGSYGEMAVFKICEQFYRDNGGILIHSYSFKVDKDQAGNIKKDENGNLFIENLGSSTEIDVLYVSQYRVYPIEVKAYKAKQIELKDDGIYGCYKTDKSPIHQNEMHCRHLYPFLFRALPNGDTRYIVPVVCLVDKCKIIDARSDWQKDYIHLTVLNNIKQFIEETNTPLEYRFDLDLVDKLLREYLVESETYLPVRK